MVPAFEKMCSFSCTLGQDGTCPRGHEELPEPTIPCNKIVRKIGSFAWLFCITQPPLSSPATCAAHAMSLRPGWDRRFPNPIVARSPSPPRVTQTSWWIHGGTMDLHGLALFMYKLQVRCDMDQHSTTWCKHTKSVFALGVD